MYTHICIMYIMYYRGVQPAAQDGSECAQYKIVNLLKTLLSFITKF